MKSNALIARAAWCITAILLGIAMVNFAVLRRSDPLLGLWDADLAGRYRMPQQTALDEQLAAEVFRVKPLQLIPSNDGNAGTSISCRELFKYYGLDATRLETANRTGNPQSRCVAGEMISIPLDSDRL